VTVTYVEKQLEFIVLL